MNPRKVLKILKETGVFDIAKTLHFYFPLVSTKRINDIILQVDSIDIAVDILFVTKDDTSKINEVIYSVLHYKDSK